MIFKEALSFDDVMLVPSYSTLESRSNVDVSVNANIKNKSFTWNHPIIPANMLTISGRDLVIENCRSGGLSILNRFISLEDQLSISEDMINYHEAKDRFGISVGIKQEDKENISKFFDLGVRIFCIDIAHGDSKMCVDMTDFIKNKYPQSLVIAGNVATKNGAVKLWSSGADIVKAGIGGGCFAAGTRVLMANGFYKNIEDIKINDYVINKNGDPVKVINSFSTGIRKISKLKNNLFYEDTFVTPDHKFWVGDLNSSSDKTLASRGYSKLLDLESKTIPKKSKYKWKKISEINQDVLLIPNKINFNMPENFSIYLDKRDGGNWKNDTKYKNDCIITTNYDSGYLFGTFLGDGNASCTINKNNNSHSGVVKWSFGLNEKEIAEKLIKSIYSIFNKTAKIEISENIIEVVFYYKPLADYLNKWGKKQNKKMPEELLVNNKEYLTGIYDGLLDSDGHYNNDGRKTLSNTSISIIELFNITSYLLFGVFPNNSKTKKTTGGLINCNIDNCNQPYRSQILKNGKIRLTKDYQVAKILGYEELNVEVPVYDITVDCETHSFIANNMIVHNSLCTTRIETGNGVPQLTAIMDIADAKANFTNKYFISDGGLKSSGDICKALCFADMVMVGNLFAGCEETPGNQINIDGRTYKEYAGSSTHKTNHIEGVVAMVPYKGKYNNILTKLLEGLKSGLSYQGVNNLTELKQYPEFVKITSAGLRESHPHDVWVK